MPVGRIATLLLSVVAHATFAHAFTHAAFAQAAPDRLVGVYDPDTGEPIADVQIVLLGTAMTWRTPSSGLVLLRNVPAGDHLLRLRRIGYQPHTEFVSFSPRDTVPLTLLLKSLPLTLPEVLVNAREERYERKLRGFLERRRSSAAPASSFITEDDLRRWGAVRWVDALVRTSGVRTDVRGGVSLRGCNRFALYLDGAMLADSSLESISLMTVAAIEVYPGPALIPSEFNATKGACGAIVVWTK